MADDGEHGLSQIQINLRRQQEKKQQEQMKIMGVFANNNSMQSQGIAGLST